MVDVGMASAFPFASRQVTSTASVSHGAGIQRLDREHFFTRSIREAGLPCAIMTPGDYLRQLTSADPT